MNINFSKFKKIDSDDKCTTLQHPSGHHLKIAHKGLSEKLLKELEDLPMHLAKGGHAKYAQKFDPNMKGSKASKPSTPDKFLGEPKEAAHSYTEPDAMGTSIPKENLQKSMHEGNYPDVVLNAMNRKAPPMGPLGAEPKQHYPPCVNPSCKSFGHSHPNCRCYGGVPEHGHFAGGGEVKGVHLPEVENVTRSDEKKYPQSAKKWMGQSEAGAHLEREDIRPGSKDKAYAKHAKVLAALKSIKPKLKGLAHGGEAEHYCSSDRPHQKDCQYFAEGSQEPVQQVPEQAEDVPKFKRWEGEQQAVPINQPEQPSAAPASEAPGQAPAEVMPQDVDPSLKSFQQDKDVTQKMMLDESQKFENDLNAGHVTPKTYQSLFNDQKLPGKIGTLFGLLIGGAGSGLSHQPNVVMQMMDQEIKNDLDAQEKNVGNRHNFMSINQQSLANHAAINQQNANTRQIKYALAYDQAMMTNLHNLAQYAAKLPPGQVKDEANQKLAMLYQTVKDKKMGLMDQASAGYALWNKMNGGNQGADTTGMKTGIYGDQYKGLGEDIEQKTLDNVPSIKGQKANRPIAKNDRDQVQAMNVLSDKAKDLISYAKAHEGTWNPQTRAIAQQKAEEMVGFYGSSLGVSGTQGNRTWLEEQIAKKNPTSVIAQELYGSGSRLKEIADSNKMRQANLLKSYGFKPKEEGSDKVKNFMSKNPHVKSEAEAEQILKKHGHL